MSGPPRVLLEETLRIARIANENMPGFDPAAGARALRGGVTAPIAGLCERWRARMTWKQLACDYGEAWSFRRYPFFTTEPMQFVAVRFPDGQPAVVFDAGARPDFFPYVARLAIDRLCKAHGWRFPEDLANELVAAAIWQLLCPTEPGFRLLEPLAVAARSAAAASAKNAALVIPVEWQVDGAKDRIVVSWDERRVGWASFRFDAPRAQLALATAGAGHHDLRAAPVRFERADFVEACKRRRDGDWELLAAAAGEQRATARLLAAVAAKELALGADSPLAAPPSLTELRVEALTVSRLAEVRALASEWEALTPNPGVEAALRAARAQLSPPPPVRAGAPGVWSWRENVSADADRARELRARPLRETELDAEDLRAAVEAGGQLLLALPTQSVRLAYGAFGSFLAAPSLLDARRLALLAQASRGSLPTSYWLPEAMRRIQSALDAREVVPFAYVLLSESWLVA